MIVREDFNCSQSFSFHTKADIHNCVLMIVLKEKLEKQYKFENNPGYNRFANYFSRKMSVNQNNLT